MVIKSIKEKEFILEKEIKVPEKLTIYAFLAVGLLFVSIYESFFSTFQERMQLGMLLVACLGATFLCWRFDRGIRQTEYRKYLEGFSADELREVLSTQIDEPTRKAINAYLLALSAKEKGVS